MIISYLEDGGLGLILKWQTDAEERESYFSTRLSNGSKGEFHWLSLASIRIITTSLLIVDIVVTGLSLLSSMILGGESAWSKQQD